VSESRRATGARFEALAARHLDRLGYRLLHKNYTIRGGELDLVAIAPDGTLCFVEVRARADAAHGTPAETVRADKRERLVKAARHYLATQIRGEPPCRFDVISIVGRGARPTIDHIEDAFRLGE
jgi:putative endonuclease